VESHVPVRLGSDVGMAPAQLRRFLQVGLIGG
jgi:hypothetical protein